MLSVYNMKYAWYSLISSVVFIIQSTPVNSTLAGPQDLVNLFESLSLLELVFGKNYGGFTCQSREIEHSTSSSEAPGIATRLPGHVCRGDYSVPC